MCFADAVTIALLGINSVWDILKREILLLPSLAGIAAGYIYMILWEGKTVSELPVSAIPGAALLLMCILFKGQIGFGDVIMVFMTGAWNGADRTTAVLTSAMICAAITAAVLLVLRKKEKEIPFVPFLLAGEILTLLLI